MAIINWSRMPHCPEEQLCKLGHPTDAGFDIRIAENVLVKNYATLNREGRFVWEILGRAEDLDIPEFKDDLYYENFTYSNGSFTCKSLGIIYGTSYEGLEELVKSNTSRSEKILFDGVIYPSNTAETTVGKPYYLILGNDSGIREDARFPFILRKKYKPQLVKTGIQLAPQSLMWTAVALRSSMRGYGIGISHALGIIDNSYNHELMLSVYAIEDNVPFLRGERVAQLIPIPQEEIELNLVDSVGPVDVNRKGFGSTGLK